MISVLCSTLAFFRALVTVAWFCTDYNVEDSQNPNERDGKQKCNYKKKCITINNT